MNTGTARDKAPTTGFKAWYRTKKLRTKFLLIILPVTLLVLSLITIFSVTFIQHSVTSTLEKSLTETASLASERVTDYLEIYRQLVIEIAQWTAELEDDEVGQPQLDKVVERNNFLALLRLDKDGISLQGNDYSQEDFFTGTKALEDGYISLNTYSEILHKDIIVISAPILRDGKFEGIIAASLDKMMLSDLMRDVAIGEGGNSFIINQKKECVAHTDNDLVGFTIDDLDILIAQDPKYQTLESLWARMSQGESGFDEYDYVSGMRMAAFTPITGAPGWSLCITVSKVEFFTEARQASTIMIVIALIFLLVVGIIVYIFINSLSRRIGVVTVRLEKLAAGDLTTPVTRGTSGDEIGRLADSTHTMVKEISEIINAIKHTLEEMAHGNLTANADAGFPGDFAEIRNSIVQNQEAISAMIQKISRASEEVARGSAQMASGAAGLSQGASEQASSIEELFSTISEIAQWAANIASPRLQRNWEDEDFEEEQELSQEEIAERRETAAKTKMEKLITAMQRISINSQQIKTISNSVESIASETSILALNASVEAAHAGDAGRGFNVIASEIRQLAAKSKEAVNLANTQSERIIHAVDRGTHMVDDTVEAVSSIVIALEQIKNTLSQISSVIESTVATAEESAASSEELSAQANLLREVISEFSCRE